MLKRYMPDTFVLVLVVVIGFSSLFPAKGRALDTASLLSSCAIFLLFFFHGLRLARQDVWVGLKHWRLQCAILFFSFGALPLAGLSLFALFPGLLSSSLWLGVIFLCALPSTVQAAISSSSLAGGNVAASVIAAAVSNLSGVVLTPLIFAAIAHVSGDYIGLSTITNIATLLLLPFILGQVAQHWLNRWAERNRVWMGRMDRFTIMLTVYVTFSSAVNEGLWNRIDMKSLATLFAVIIALQSFAFSGAWWLGRAIGMSRADQITLLFSGTHKTLATGAPMARILFPAAQAGLIIIPLMLYHQLQLIMSAWLAARFSRPT